MTKTKVISVILIVTMLCGIGCFAVGCRNNPDDYTLEEHIERISTLIEDEFINEDSRQDKYSFITDYKLYPLYNNRDELRYFLVEFAPYGFAFILLSVADGTKYGSMYHYNAVYVNNSWRRYRLCINGKEPDAFNGTLWNNNNKYYDNRRFEVDNDGEYIEYNHSPYAVAKVLNAKLYFLDVNDGFVPAIKENEKYINLVSMEEFECQEEKLYNKEVDAYFENSIPSLSVGFVIKWTL